MPGAVSDSSPLIGLSIVGHLELLREFYGEVWIPPAVQREVVADERSRAGSRETAAALAAGWLRVVAPTDLQLVEQMRSNLDPGESEAIALVLTNAVAALVIDEEKGRQIARDHNINVIGTVGVLIRAAREGRLSSLQDDLDLLRQNRFRISNHLYRNALRDSRQPPS